MGIGIVGEDQTQLTPFQRQIFEAEQARRAREKEKKMNEAQSGGVGSSRSKNAMAGKNPTQSRSETIRYESEGERDDDVLEVI